MAERSFSTLADFLSRTAGDDRQFLTEEGLAHFPAVVCGMANGAGGWVVLGASQEEGGEVELKGLSNPPELRERLLGLAGGKAFSVFLPISIFPLAAPVPLLLVRVPPAGWHSRPVWVRGVGAYRRVEGENVISGLGARFRLGLDALERLRDDLPAKDAELDEESVAAFREAVVARRPEWGGLSMPAFLARSLVLDGGDVTQAGAWLLGREGAAVRVELHLEGRERALEVHNLWRAYSLLPRLTRSLSAACAGAFRECFVNALLHAEHDAGGVRVLLAGRPVSMRVENPGLVRTWRPGESVCRNFRLMRMFRLFGGARGEGWGLRAIRGYQSGFRLDQDPLELLTAARLDLEPKALPPMQQPSRPRPEFRPKAKPQLQPQPFAAPKEGMSFGDAAQELEEAIAVMRSGKSE